MSPYKVAFSIVLISVIMFSRCQAGNSLNEKNKIFHAGPSVSGLSAVYFALYKDNTYKYCDGDFLDPGCYTGRFDISGDTIKLHDFRQNDHVKYGRFLIRRYDNQDSTYWQWKYPKRTLDWSDMKLSDKMRGATGDVFPINDINNVIFDSLYYFIIRFDDLKNYR